MMTLSPFFLILFLLGVAHASTEGSKPNILFILTDDQGYGDLGCYGSENITTPNIDRLRSEGMKFECFYVHNRCSPTRAAFMTGCHASRVGAGKVIYRKDRMGINSAEVTVAELLGDSGYATGIVGKWHLGEWEDFNPLNHGFDSFYGFMEYGDGSKGIFRNREVVEQVKNKTDGVHSPKLLAAGIEFIKANKDQPFFLYYASPLPHTKWKPLKSFSGTSKQGVYGDVIQEIDWQVGGLLDVLDELGIADNTLVIYSSDNGPQLNVEGHGSSGPLRDGKWTNFEGGIRVPCLMRWPGRIPRGSSNDEITGIIDLLPTFCSLAGSEVPSDRTIDGRNILPYLLNEEVESPIHDTFVVPGHTIRHEDWKLLVGEQQPGGNGNKGMQGRIAASAGSLFDLKNDPGETTDLSSAQPERVRELSRMMEVYMKKFRGSSREIGRIADTGEGR